MKSKYENKNKTFLAPFDIISEPVKHRHHKINCYFSMNMTLAYRSIAIGQGRVSHRIARAYHHCGPLRKKCPYSDLFCSAFPRIRTEYGEIRSISSHSVRMRENPGKMLTRITPNVDTFYTVVVFTWETIGIKEILKIVQEFLALLILSKLKILSLLNWIIATKMIYVLLLNSILKQLQ